jgi:hypothetical protein
MVQIDHPWLIDRNLNGLVVRRDLHFYTTL